MKEEKLYTTMKLVKSSMGVEQVVRKKFWESNFWQLIRWWNGKRAFQATKQHTQSRKADRNRVSLGNERRALWLEHERRMALDEAGQTGKEWIVQDLTSHFRDVGFYLKDKRKPVESFKQGTTWSGVKLLCLQCENELYGIKVNIENY